jgi:WD40 repeat protein
MADVFISYSRVDSAFARQLADALSASGRDVWRDVDDIRPAEEFMPAIQRAIEEAHAVIFVLSPEFFRSEYCGREFDHAELHHKRVVPVLRREISSEVVPPTLARLNWIYAREADEFARVVDAIIEADTDLAWVRAHTRLVVRSVEWDTAKREKSYLLHGVDLSAAEQALALAVPGTPPEPTTLQRSYVLESRRNASARQRLVLTAVALGLVIAASLAVVAEIQRRSAVDARQRGTARQLAAQSELVRRPFGEPLTLSLLLAAESLRHYWSIEGDQALRRALALFPRPALSRVSFENQHPLLSPDGRRVAFLGDKTLQFHDLATQQTSPPIDAPGVALLAWSPDGQQLLGIDQSSRLRLWRATDGSEQQLFVVKGSVRDVIAFSANGQVVAVAEEPDDMTAATPGAVHVWNSATKEHVTFTPTHPSVSLWVSDDAAHVLTMGSRMFDSRIQLWRPPFRKPSSERRLDGRIAYASLDATGTELAFVNRVLHIGGGASGENEVLLETLDDSSETRRLPHPNPVTSITTNRGDTHLATTCTDNVIRVWTRGDGEAVAQVAGGPGVRAVALSDDAQRLAFVDGESVLHLYTNSGKTRLTSVPLERITSIAFQPGGDLVTAVDEDGHVSVLEVEAGADERTIRMASDISRMRFTPDGKHLIAGGGDTLAMFPVSRTAPPIPLAQTATSNEVLAPDGKTYFTLGAHGIRGNGVEMTQIGDDDLRQWDVASGQLLMRRPLEWQYARTLSPDGRYLATSIGDREVSVSTLVDGRDIVRLGTAQLAAALGSVVNPADQKPLSKVTDLAFTPHSDRLVVLWDWRVAQVWTIADWTAAKPIACDGECSLDGFDPTGHFLILGSRGSRQKRLWDVRSGGELTVSVPSSKDGAAGPEKVDITELTFSTDGRLMAAAGRANAVIVWDIAGRQLLRQMTYAPDVVALRFTSDAAYLATGSTDSTARVWDVRTGQELSRIVREEIVFDVLFSPDDRYLATHTTTPEAHVWLWRRDDLLAEAGRRLSRNLTVEEWGLYLPDEPYQVTFPRLPDPRKSPE